MNPFACRDLGLRSNLSPMDLGGGGIVHATKFGQQAAAGYIAATHNAATDSLSNLYATRRIFLCGWR
jgi:hypothetical protein